MNKKLIGMAAALGLVVSSLAVADADSGFSTTKHPSAKMAAVNSTLVQPTEIIINNASYETIYAYIPAANVTDAIDPRDNDHVQNYRGAYNVRIVLKRANGAVFYDATFCPHASITVYGFGPYDTRIDNKACNSF